jgi:hypothetical protein
MNFAAPAALSLLITLAPSHDARAESTERIKKARDYQICLIQKQQERDVKGRPLLDRSYAHYLSIHKKTYAILASSLRIMERDLSRNFVSLMAYEAIPDFILEQMDPKPAFYNLSRLMVSLRNETREFLVELGLDPEHQVLKKPMITRKDIFSISSDLKNAPVGSPEQNVGLPFYLSPALRLADELMTGLSQILVPTEEGFSLHSDVYTSPQESLDRVATARKKAIDGLRSLDVDLKKWTPWGGGNESDCAAEFNVLQETPVE